MSASEAHPETFQDKFCRHFDVPPDRYAWTVLKYTLYPQARWLLPAVPTEFLEPDRVFIDAVGRLTRWRGFSGEVWEFQRDVRNRGLLRRVLRLRVSVGRMRVLFSEVWDKPVSAGIEDSADLGAQDTRSFLID
jgi:hypothetical protein